MTHGELLGRIDVMLGGRVAEQVVFGEVSTGAHNDLQRATDTARAMITEYGMGRTLGPATYPRQQRPLFLGAGEAGPAPREYSERTAAQIDDEVKVLLEEREARVRRLIEERREPLEKVARRLLEVEVLYAEEFERLAGCGAPPAPAAETA